MIILLEDFKVKKKGIEPKAFQETNPEPLSLNLFIGMFVLYESRPTSGLNTIHIYLSTLYNWRPLFKLV